MPGDLKDPESSAFSTGHFDSTYEPGTNALETRPLNIEHILNAISRSLNGCPMSKEDMARAESYLQSKNLLTRSPGDQEVQEAIQEYIKNKNSARKVARTWNLIKN